MQSHCSRAGGPVFPYDRWWIVRLPHMIGGYVLSKGQRLNPKCLKSLGSHVLITYIMFNELDIGGERVEGGPKRRSGVVFTYMYRNPLQQTEALQQTEVAATF